MGFFTYLVFPKVAFFLEFHKTEEILAERVLKIGPNGFLQVIVKWLARYLTFRFFPISTCVRKFFRTCRYWNYIIWEFEIRKSSWNFLELGIFIDFDRLIIIKEVLNHYIAFFILKIHFSFLAPNLKFDRFSEENLENLRT